MRRRRNRRRCDAARSTDPARGRRGRRADRAGRLRCVEGVTTRRSRSAVELAPAVFPALMLTVFFIVPFGIMIAVTFFGGVLGFSLFLAALVAALCVAIGLPFTWQLARLPRRLQVLWLIGLLSILSLSEVIIGFAWSTLFSRTAGITNILVALGLMHE